MSWLVSLIIGLLGLLYYKNNKLKSIESLLLNDDTKEKLDKETEKQIPNTIEINQLQTDIKKEQEAIKNTQGDMSNEDLANYFNNNDNNK